MILFQFNTGKNLHFIILLDEKNAALDSNTHMKLVNNFLVKESFPFALFCSLVLIYVGYNGEHMEVDEGKQKVDLSYRKGEAIMLASDNKPAEETSQRNFTDKAKFEFSKKTQQETNV